MGPKLLRKFLEEMGPICFKESSFSKEFDPMCWETIFYVSMGNLGLFASCLQVSWRNLGSLLERTMLWANLSQATKYPRGIEHICPKESHILRKFEPICLWEVASLFPRGNGGNLNKSSSPQGNCKPLTFEENLLEEFAQELYLFSKMSVKKMKIWEKKIKPLGLRTWWF